MPRVIDRPTSGVPYPDQPGPGSQRSVGIGLAQWVVVALLVGAGAVHLAMAPSHFGASAAEGMGFVVAAWLQIGMALAVLLRPSRPVLFAIIGVSGVSIVAWAISRTTGLPFGAHADHAEAITIVDGVTVAMEAATIVLAVMLLSRAVLAYRSSPALTVVAVVGILALTSAIIAAPEARNHSESAHGGHTSARSEASASGGTGHAHDDGTADASGANTDQGLQIHGHESDITYKNLPPKTKAEVDLVIAEWAHKYPTGADAVAGGWRKTSMSLYGIGAHYTLATGFSAEGAFDFLHPNALLYDGDGPDAKFAGVSYIMAGGVPEGFTGKYDSWHLHESVCVKGGTVVSLSDPSSDVWLSDSECVARGGRVLAIAQDQMMHLWIGPGYFKEAPIFAHDHPKLLDGFLPTRDA